MGEAVLPIFEYIALQLVVMVIGLNIVQERIIGTLGVLKSWIFGQIMLFAVLQVLGVPMILMRCKFDVLFLSYCSAALVLFGLGCWKLGRKKTRIRIKAPEFTPIEMLLLMVVILIVLWQAGNYFFGIHLDEDDARWLAEANDALVTGDMITRDVHTGEYIARFTEIREVTSPWPMFFASLARLLNTRVSIVAHTIYPTVEIAIMYGIYYLIANELLDKRDARIAFTLFTSVIILFFGGTGYTQGAFSLIRLWQGKATVAGVIIPLFVYFFICLNKRNKTSDWLLVMVLTTASCLLSGVGIIVGIIMTGVYGFYDIIAYQRWKRTPIWVVSMMPSFAFSLVYFLLKR